MTEKDKTPLTGLQIKVSKHGSPRIAQLLQNTIFGTEGKLRYRQQEIFNRIRNQANIQFIEVLKSNRVLGTVGMARRNVRYADKSINSLYVRYLSVAQSFKTKNQSSQNSKNRKRNKGGILRELIGAEITNHFESPFIENEENGIFYAYVESANSNSRNLCMSMGFEPARKVETLIFSRFNPIQRKSIQNISEEEQDEVLKQLREFYKDHSFYFEDQLFTSGFYLVKKEGEKIVGGIRAHPVHWELVEYPGFEGWLMRDFLPYLPLTSRLFQPGVFKFLAFDYAWHTPGYEHLIPQMMSHCCSLFGINAGMIWGDMSSELIKDLKTGNELGFIHSVVGSVYADLMIRPINSGTKKDQGIESQETDDPELEFSSKDDSIEETVSKQGLEEETEKHEASGEKESDPPKKKSGESEKFRELKEILKQPVFVSALDMT